MKKNLLGKMVITGIISAAMLASTAASTWAADKSDKDVLRVGMECAYAHSIPTLNTSLSDLSAAHVEAAVDANIAAEIIPVITILPKRFFFIFVSSFGSFLLWFFVARF